MPFHSGFRDNNPRTAFIVDTLTNGLPDALDFGAGDGNANQNTEREPPVDAATQPAQPPRQTPFGNSNTLLFVGAAVLLGGVLLVMVRR